MNEKEFSWNFPFLRDEEVTHICGAWLQYMGTEELSVHYSTALDIEFYVQRQWGLCAQYEHNTGIFVTQTEIENLTVEEFNAVLAHEDQHRILDHIGESQRFVEVMTPLLPPESLEWFVTKMHHRHELEADQGAAKAGLAKELVSALNKARGFLDMDEDDDGEGASHPSNTTRARALGITV